MLKYYEGDMLSKYIEINDFRVFENGMVVKDCKINKYNQIRIEARLKGGMKQTKKDISGMNTITSYFQMEKRQNKRSMEIEEDDVIKDKKIR